MLIGSKIRTLRKSKSITQLQLAEALSVSAQTVSKWETHLSTPDITVLPMIARYFNITMDELFNYRPDALNYKERFIRFMVDNGMLRFGDFILKSGRRSPYLIHSGYNLTGSQISKLGEFYATCIREHNLDSNCLIGIDQREIPLVIATGITLFNKYGIDTSHCVDYDIKNITFESHEITLITDAFTTGTTLSSALECIRSKMNKYPSDIVVCVDRMECSNTSTRSAKHELETRYGVKIHPIINVDDLLKAIENGIISAGNHYEALKEYTKRYRGE